MQPEAFGDILKGLAREASRARKTHAKRDQIQGVLDELLGDKKEFAHVVSWRGGVVLIETTSTVFFQELEGYYRAQILDAFHKADLQVSELRVRLARA